MKKLTLLILAAMLIVLTVAAPLPAGADFGDFSGDSDFGSFDYDFGGSDYDYDYDYDSDGGFYFFPFIGGGSGSSTAVLIILIILIIVLKNLKKRKAPVAGGATPTDRSSLTPMSAYTALDENFSETELEEKISNLYIQFQNAWQARDMESLRPYLTDGLYAKCDRQLTAYREHHQTNHVERISVLGVELLGYRQENGNDVIVADLKTRIVDYVTDDATGAILRGSNTAEKFMRYEWELVRATGGKTGQTDGMTAQQCPHCGAPINMNQTAKCPYCGSILSQAASDWAVREIRGIAQKTN